MHCLSHLSVTNSPSARIADNDTIVNGERVTRKASNVPGSDLNGISQRLAQREVI